MAQQLENIILPTEIIESVSKQIDWLTGEPWISWAWSLLVQHGYGPAEIDEEDEKYIDHVICLASLAQFFDNFQQVHSGLDSINDYSWELISDERPDATLIELGRYCEREGIYDQFIPETESGLLREAVTEQVRVIAKKLKEILGDSRLFISLVVSGRGQYEDDNASHELNDPSNMMEFGRSYEWLLENCR